MRSYFKRRTISIERYADILLFLFRNFFCNRRKWMNTLMDRIANPVFTDNFSHMQEYKRIGHWKINQYLQTEIDKPLVECCTRYSSILIKGYSQLANIAIPPISLLYPILSPTTGWTNWPINKIHISNLKWRPYVLYRLWQVFFVLFNI